MRALVDSSLEAAEKDACFRGEDSKVAERDPLRQAAHIRFCSTDDENKRCSDAVISPAFLLTFI